MVTIRSSSSEVSSPALRGGVSTSNSPAMLRCRSLVGCIPLVEVDIGLLADQVGVSATDTLDLGQGVHDLLFAIDVGVQKTQNLFDSGQPLASITTTFLPPAKILIRPTKPTYFACVPIHLCGGRRGKGMGMTYELEVRLLTRDERHDGQLYRSLPSSS